MASSLQPATIILPDQEDIDVHLESFVSHLKDIIEIWHYEPIEFDVSGPDYPSPFGLTVNGVPTNAAIIDLSSAGNLIANLTICYAVNAVGHAFFFTLVRDARSNWQPATHILPMGWSQFIQLTKAQQYTALGC